MAVALGSIGTLTSYTAHPQLDLAAPSGIADGDLLVAYIFSGAVPTASTITAPGGWTGLAGTPTNLTGGGLNGRYYVFYKIAASESGGYTFAQSISGTNTTGLIIRYTGVDTASPLSPTPTVNTGSSTTATATGFTTTAASTFVIFAEHDWGENANDTVVPAGTTPTFTERLDGALLYIADGTLTTPGATGDKSHTCNNAGASPWSAALIGLNPAATGTTLTADAGSYALTGTTAVENFVMPCLQAGAF